MSLSHEFPDSKEQGYCAICHKTVLDMKHYQITDIGPGKTCGRAGKNRKTQGI